jgi:hypothetical protein
MPWSTLSGTMHSVESFDDLGETRGIDATRYTFGKVFAQSRPAVEAFPKSKAKVQKSKPISLGI